jgi:anti-sigma B factor antagonist
MAAAHDGPPVRVEGHLDGTGELTVSIIGELDIASVEAAQEGLAPLLGHAPDRVVFNLEKLDFMDSSGIALLIQTANRFGSVEVRNPTAIVRRALEVTGLAETFGLQP